LAAILRKGAPFKYIRKKTPAKERKSGRAMPESSVFKAAIRAPFIVF
jgi:hypothetical protein